MTVTIDRIFKFTDGKSRTLAMVDVCCDGIHIKGFKVVQGQKSLFMSVPSEKSKNGQWFELVRFDTMDMKREVENAILEAYNAEGGSNAVVNPVN